MPEYINTSRKGTSYAQGKLYKRGEVVILDKSYAEKKPGSWKLLSDYKKEQEAARETNALRETPAEQVARLTKELKVATAANSKIAKAQEQNPNLVVKPEEKPMEYKDMLKKAKELGYEGTGKKPEVESFLKEKEKEVK